MLLRLNDADKKPSTESLRQTFSKRFHLYETVTKRANSTANPSKQIDDRNKNTARKFYQESGERTMDNGSIS